MQAIRLLMEDDTNVVQPDLMVLCNYKKDINEQDRYKGTPTLVAEILSNSSRGKDQVKKLDLYMESGIEEFWLIDPKYQTITVHLFKDYDITYSKQYALGQTACSQCFHNLAVDSTTIFT